MSQLKELPKIGLGTWKLKPEQAEFSVKKAIEIGYRFIDTAQAYKNEQGVGNGLRYAFENLGVKREDVVVATKIFVFNYKPKKVFKTFSKSLKKLQLDYVDILYVHWPAFFFGYNHKKTLGAFSKLVDEGKVKFIGVSNFTEKLINEAIEACDKPIFANQVEHHPLLQQWDLLKFLKEKGIYMISYSPLAHGKVFQIKEILDIAKKHNVSVAQVSLAWVMAVGGIPIPKATSEEHIRDNFKALDLKLDNEDMEKIKSIKIQKRLLNPPIIRPKW
ncbi:MAG: aldo/keto reductase [Promethearchaeota archaeon]